MTRKRSNPVFSRESEGEDLPDWFQDYADRLQKNSVKSADEDRSLFDQISEVIGTKSKFSTVEDAVRDMRERTGLSAYIKQQAQVKNAENAPSKDETPALFAENPHAEKFIKKYIESRKGSTSIPAVLTDLARLFKGFKSSHLEDGALKKYISKLILEQKQQQPQEDSNSADMLGEVENESSDDLKSHDDIFSTLSPAKF